MSGRVKPGTEWYVVATFVVVVGLFFCAVRNKPLTNWVVDQAAVPAPLTLEQVTLEEAVQAGRGFTQIGPGKSAVFVAKVGLESGDSYKEASQLLLAKWGCASVDSPNRMLKRGRNEYIEYEFRPARK